VERRHGDHRNVGPSAEHRNGSIEKVLPITQVGSQGQARGMCQHGSLISIDQIYQR
jgi:hypothetical protein